MIVYWVYSLELPQWGDSNEYTQHTIPWQNKTKSLIFVFLSYWKNFVGTEKRVWIIHGKRAIRVRAIGLYCMFFCHYFKGRQLVASCLLSSTPSPIWKEVYSESQAFALKRSKSFSFGLLLFSEGRKTICWSWHHWMCIHSLIFTLKMGHHSNCPPWRQPDNMHPANNQGLVVQNLTKLLAIETLKFLSWNMANTQGKR